MPPRRHARVPVVAESDANRIRRGKTAAQRHGTARPAPVQRLTRPASSRLTVAVSLPPIRTDSILPVSRGSGQREHGPCLRMRFEFDFQHRVVGRTQSRVRHRDAARAHNVAAFAGAASVPARISRRGCLCMRRRRRIDRPQRRLPTRAVASGGMAFAVATSVRARPSAAGHRTSRSSSTNSNTSKQRTRADARH